MLFRSEGIPRRDFLRLMGAGTVAATWGVAFADDRKATFRIASFSCDVTCPVGHPLLGGLRDDAKSIADPLSAHGFVLLGDEPPIVFCSVDWCEIRNESYDLWRDTLAAAAGTKRERVLVTCIHQHDAPLTDRQAARYLEQVGQAGAMFDLEFEVDAIEKVAAALKESLRTPVPVTHIGLGSAVAEELASSRRVVGSDGVPNFERGSSNPGNKAVMDAPEGEIDPQLKMISFWSNDKPLVALSAYACHPMSYYGNGEVSADFVGRARALWQARVPEVHHIYASGCSGDVTVGKYNDGAPENRPVLAERMAVAMAKAWESTERQELRQIRFESTPLSFAFRETPDFTRAAMQQVLENNDAPRRDRVLAAMGLACRDRVDAGQPIDFCMIDFGPAKLVLFPGETFVGFQLRAQSMASDKFVMCVGYGESWTGYIPTKSAVEDRFVNDWNWVSRDAESKLLAAMKTLL